MGSSEKNRKLMTHLVIGHPSLKENAGMIRAMSDAGVDYVELQIPFSDPIADGPTILNANQKALQNGIPVSACFDFAREAAGKYRNIGFLFMTYYNIVFHGGVERFIVRAARSGVYGLIVPDITIDEDREKFFMTCASRGIHPVYVFSPTTDERRLKRIKSIASGFAYCTSRIGITGAGKRPYAKLGEYIKRARSILNLPIAVGFGIDGPESARRIAECADIIVIGSKIIDIVDAGGKNSAREIYTFLRKIKKAI